MSSTCPSSAWNRPRRQGRRHRPVTVERASLHHAVDRRPRPHPDRAHLGAHRLRRLRAAVRRLCCSVTLPWLASSRWLRRRSFLSSCSTWWGPALPDGGQAFRTHRHGRGLLQFPRRVGILTPGIAWAVLLVAPVPAIFAACAAGLATAWAIAANLHPRLGTERPSHACPSGPDHILLQRRLDHPPHATEPRPDDPASPARSVISRMPSSPVSTEYPARICTYSHSA